MSPSLAHKYMLVTTNRHSAYGYSTSQIGYTLSTNVAAQHARSQTQIHKAWQGIMRCNRRVWLDVITKDQSNVLQQGTSPELLPPLFSSPLLRGQERNPCCRGDTLCD